MSEPDRSREADLDHHAEAGHDLYALPKDAIREPPRTFARALTQIGPGLILAASIVGTGELINTTSLGAQAGFGLLWLILLSCVIKVFVQVELGRYAITHGRTTLEAFDSLPGPRLGASWICWLWLIMMLTTQAQIAAMEGTVGQAAHMAFPSVSHAMAESAGRIVPAWGTYLAGHQEHIWAGLTTVAAILLLLSGGYHRLERVTTLLVAAVTLFTVGSVLVLQFTDFRITGADLLKGFDPVIPAAALDPGVLGVRDHGRRRQRAGGLPLLVYREGLCSVRRGPQRRLGLGAPGAGWIRVMQIDAWFSMMVFTVATVAFYFLGAAVLHPSGLRPEGSQMIPTLSQMYLQPLMGTPLAWLSPFTRVGFLLGAWAVLFKTLYVATAANSRLTVDFLHRAGIWQPASPAARDRMVKVFCVIYPAASLGLYYAYREPKALITAGGIAQAMMLPFIAGATIYLRRRDADPRVQPSRLSDILTWLAFLAISGVAVYSTFNQVRDLIVRAMKQP